MITLSVTLSEACNLNCSYCNVDKHSKESIDEHKFLKVFKEVRQKNPDETIKIDFFGGEPLIHFNKIIYILENIHDDNVNFFMPTNGLLLTEENLKVLNKYNVQISLSFDGLWQERNRPQLSGNSSLHAYEKKKDLFKSIPNFKIHTMIYPGCYNLLENHLYLSEYGANPELTLIKDVSVWTRGSVELLKQGIDEIFDWYIEDTSREMPEIINYYLNSVLLWKMKKIETKSCGASTSYLSFSGDKLVACTRFENNPEMEALIPKFIEMPECQTCEVKQYCKKGCMYENIKNGKPIVEVCEIFKYFYIKINNILIELKDDENFKNIIKQKIKDEYGIN